MYFMLRRRGVTVEGRNISIRGTCDNPVHGIQTEETESESYTEVGTSNEGHEKNAVSVSHRPKSKFVPNGIQIDF